MQKRSEGEDEISSFDSMIDMIGAKEGYGDGEYVLYPADGAMVFGDDFAEILGYFKKCRDDNTFNKKADVSPLALKPYLPWVSLLEPIWDGGGRLEDARVTLHGSAVAAAYTDNTHRVVSEIHTPQVAERVLASMQLAADRKGGVIGISEERDIEPPHVRLNILYLPLSQDGKTISHFFSYVRLDPID